MSYSNLQRELYERAVKTLVSGIINGKDMEELLDELYTYGHSTLAEIVWKLASGDSEVVQELREKFLEKTDRFTSFAYNYLSNKNGEASNNSLIDKSLALVIMPVILGLMLNPIAWFGLHVYPGYNYIY